MKKVLLATTALVATSGFAMAQGIELSGNAEIGIVDDGVHDAQFLTSVDVRFSLSGETDNGLTFGATIDLDDLADTAGAGFDGVDAIDNEPADYTVFLSGSFGTITIGDTDGALDFAMSEVNAGTAIFDDHTAHSGFNGNGGLDGSIDGQVARYDYSFGDFAFAVSAELDDTDLASTTGTFCGVIGDTCGDAFGIGARWSGSVGGLSDLAVGIGYQENDHTDLTGVSVRAGFGDIAAVLNYTDADVNGVSADHTAIGVTYSSGPLLLHANWGEFDAGGVKADGFGLVANYDLGGGAVAAFGYGDGEGTETWSAGIRMDF